MITKEQWKSMSSVERSEFFALASLTTGTNGGKSKATYGFGINDCGYRTTINYDGATFVCPAYAIWMNIIKRCYSAKYLDECTAHSGVVVCEEWRSFKSFRYWWVNNVSDGMVLSRKFLCDHEAYSPETCVYVPQWLNTFVNHRKTKESSAPIGTYFDKKARAYRVDCSNPMTGRQEYIGYFKNPENAWEAWRNRKLEIALDLKPKMDEIDMRIYPRVVEIINNAK